MSRARVRTLAPLGHRPPGRNDRPRRKSSEDMTKCQLLLVLGLLFFFFGMGFNATDEGGGNNRGLAMFFWILSVPFFIGFWKTIDKE